MEGVELEVMTDESTNTGTPEVARPSSLSFENLVE